MDNFYQELFGVLTRARPRPSKAAAMQQPAKEMVTICKKEYMDLQDNKCANIIHQTIRQSKGSVTTGKWNKSSASNSQLSIQMSKFKKEKKKLPHINGLY